MRSMFSVLLLVGVGFAGVPVVIWEKTYDSGDTDEPGDVAVDSEGNVYVAGSCANSEGLRDFCILKYDTDGSLIWDRYYDAGADDMAQGVAVDASGNVYATGFTLDVGIQNFLTVKYDPEGNVVWDRTHNVGYDRAYGVAVDGVGNVYVTGYCIDLGGDGNFLTVKYDPNGNLMWEKMYGGNRDDMAQDVAVDASGNVYVTGYSYEGQRFDLRLIKYDSQGNLKWNRPYDSGSDDFAFGIALDGIGNIYVAGSCAAYLTVRFDPQGNSVWERIYGANGQAEAVAVDAFDNVYVTGSVEIGWEYDFLTIKYNMDGILIWESPYAPGELATGIALDTSGCFYVTGSSYNENNSNIRTIKCKEVEAVEEQGFITSPVTLEVIDNLSSTPSLKYSLPAGTNSKLTFYSADGRKIATYLLDPSQSTFTWNAKEVPAGVYFARLTVGNESITAKAILIR